ncbi:uncharacterized protein LOC111371316 isoform X1 [Olea europaea var. sylvestris]|uniref:uncharacterized protein LOC111371316 isoform X1 n=1 Tax=Olea europaea var. sylvestris TaxID=158386 RepID=UPI000C1D1141|nr:uncharacterized protein LOC111371316 isoform X1 [Olea europaea var. sylvestris]
MSLLEVIIKASSTAPTHPDPDSNYPIVFNPDPILLKLKPETDELKEENPIKRVTGWEISQTDAEMIETGQRFFKKLKRKLKNTNTFSKDEFLGMFTSYLEKVGEKVGISVGVDKSDEGYPLKLVDRLGFFMGRDVKSLILEACVTLEVWDTLKSLIINGNVEHLCISNLVHNLIEKRRSDLVVLCVKHLSDLQTYDLMCILKYFLLPPRDGYESLVSVRKEWENQALLAIEKVGDRGLGGKQNSLAREASFLLMVAHDEFTVSELCLHYLLASLDLDEVIFSACVSKLNGEEMMALINYLGKWLRKYEKFPQVAPCPKASSMLGLKACEWVPTFESVVKCLGLVVDKHFSSLVLHSEFHDELRSLEEVVSSLVAEARLCGTLTNLTERLRGEHQGMPAAVMLQNVSDS